MRSVDLGRTLRLTSRGWMLAGVLALGWGLLASGLAPQLPRIAPLSETRQSPEAAFEAQRLAAALRLWAQEGGAEGDDFSAGEAAFDMAAIRHDPRWARVAVARTQAARKALPGMAQAEAWFGASHAVLAREFPVQGWWQVLPGPGFARIYHVLRAEAALNRAVEIDPADPVVRLTRAASFAGMPAFFGTRPAAQADFDRLAAWAADPSRNPAYADVLAAPDWRSAFYRNHAKALEADGQIEAAQADWRRLAAETTDSVTREYAQWNVARLIR